jgi:hypothetical protein
MNDLKKREASSYLPFGESIVDMWEEISKRRDVRRDVRREIR